MPMPETDHLGETIGGLTMRRSLLAALSAALILVACGSDDADPAAVIADYQEARNSGDVDAVMGLYAEDALVKDHPLDGDGIATGVDEIRALEEQVPAVQGSGDGAEYFDMVVSGSTVTFKSTFRYGSDGIASGGSAGCAGGIDHVATVEEGKLTLVDWGPGSSSLCS